MSRGGAILTNIKQSNPKDALAVNKVALSVVPLPPLMEAALGMMEGACKYGRHNWRVTGVRASVYYDAVVRHLAAYWEGEDIDPASGVHHLSKAMSSLLVLRDAQLCGMCEDDRPPCLAPDAWLQQLNESVENLVEKYPTCEKAFTEKGKQDYGL